jgi:hypothetical protein
MAAHCTSFYMSDKTKAKLDSVIEEFRDANPERPPPTRGELYRIAMADWLRRRAVVQREARASYGGLVREDENLGE